MKKPLSIVWFKKDLRIQDHRPLRRAAAHGSCLPLYIVEPELWKQADHSPRQWEFVRECLVDLDGQLAPLGQRLYVQTGDALSIFQRLHEQWGIASISSHQETGNLWTYDRDRRIATWAKSHAIPWHEDQAGGVVRRLNSRDHWAQRWERAMAEPVTPPPSHLEGMIDMSTLALPRADELFLRQICANIAKVADAEKLCDCWHHFLITAGTITALKCRVRSQPLMRVHDYHPTLPGVQCRCVKSFMR